MSDEPTSQGVSPKWQPHATAPRDVDGLGVGRRSRARSRLAAALEGDRSQQAKATALLAVISVLAGFLLSLVSGEAGFRAGSFGRLEAGTLLVLTPAQAWAAVALGDHVMLNDTVRTDALEGARLAVRGDGLVSLSPGTRATLNDRQVELAIGSVLFDVPSTYAARSFELAATGTGTWRMDTSQNPRVAVYQGTVWATRGRLKQISLASPREVDRYLEVRFTSDVVSETMPLNYGAQDPWDALHARGLLAIDGAVEAAAAEVRATYGQAPRPQTFYEAFAVVDDGIELAIARFDTRGQPEGFGPPADVLMAVLISRLIAERAFVSLQAAIAEVDELRRAGATWGVVLARRDLSARDFEDALDLSLREIANLGEDAPAAASPELDQSASPPTAPTNPTTPPLSPSDAPTPSGNPGLIPEQCDDPAAAAPSCVSALVDELLRIVEEIVPPK
ncbi:MAG: hypothetical protein ACI867_000707 [Glaciecola sp.]|jgi:hypothetical protein